MDNKRNTIQQAAFDSGFEATSNGVWITDGYWDKELERLYEIAYIKGVSDNSESRISKFMELQQKA